MKCRYKYCKLGGEVEKEVAVKNGNMYYHKECYKKHTEKRRMREELVSRGMLQRDVNIALKKAIDEQDYDVDYIWFIINNRARKITDPYKILYQLKIDKNYEEFRSIEELKQRYMVNQHIKSSEIEDDSIKFDIDLNRNKRYEIY